MKKVISVLSIAVLALGSFACADETSEVEEKSTEKKTEEAAAANKEVTGIQFFEGTWEEALAKSKAEGKLIFLDAYAEWCGPCKRMAKKVFTQPVVGDFYNENFINFKMDMEKGVGPELAMRFGLRAYPTLYFIGSDGNPVKSQVGYQEAAGLIEFGKSVQNVE